MVPLNRQPRSPLPPKRGRAARFKACSRRACLWSRTPSCVLASASSAAAAARVAFTWVLLATSALGCLVRRDGLAIRDGLALANKRRAAVVHCGGGGVCAVALVGRLAVLVLVVLGTLHGSACGAWLRHGLRASFVALSAGGVGEGGGMHQHRSTKNLILSYPWTKPRGQGGRPTATHHHGYRHCTPQAAHGHCRARNDMMAATQRCYRRQRQR